MITEKEEYIEYLDELRGIEYLINSTTHMTTGDDVKYAKEALSFLSHSMNKILNKLELLNQK